MYQTKRNKALLTSDRILWRQCKALAAHTHRHTDTHTKGLFPLMRFQSFSAYLTSLSCAFTPSVYTKTLKTMQNDEKRVSIWKRFWRCMIRFRNQKRFRINTRKRKNDLTSVISDDMIGCIALELLCFWQLSANLTSNASRWLCKNELCKREFGKRWRCV